MDDFALSRPIARGAGRCHVLALELGAGTMVACCGIACGEFCGEQSYLDQSDCAVHNEPLCRECRTLLDELEQGGEWRGVQGDPDGPQAKTVCSESDCPALIPVVACWCREHLEVCQEPACQHGAHYCEGPAHFCADHAAEG